VLALLPAAIQDATSDSALLAGRSHDHGVPHAQRTLLPGAPLLLLHALRQNHKADGSSNRKQGGPRTSIDLEGSANLDRNE
jgi:hypothetical protein